MADKKILLIEPGYKNKYPPLGLMKIAQYHGPRGKRDIVKFIKGEDRSVLNTAWDRIYVTTLFSFEYARITQSIDFALQVANGSADRVFVGGIAASLMPERFAAERRWHGIRFIKGLLSQPPAVSLQLDDFSDELYADDQHSTPIEDLIPDYGILEQIDYRYPVQDAYFAYTSRGCIRKCSFCGVPKLEGGQRDTDSLTGVVRGIEKRYGPKKTSSSWTTMSLLHPVSRTSSQKSEILVLFREQNFGVRMSGSQASAVWTSIKVSMHGFFAKTRCICASSRQSALSLYGLHLTTWV